MSNPTESEFVETTTRVYLQQREDARESSFARAFPLLILAFMVAGMVAMSNQGSGPSTINNNHHIEVK